MKKRHTAVLLPAAALLLFTTGCASRGYVDGQVMALEQRVGQVEAVDRQMKEAQDAAARSETAAKKAETAAVRAEEAAKRAEAAADKAAKAFELMQKK